MGYISCSHEIEDATKTHLGSSPKCSNPLRLLMLLLRSNDDIKKYVCFSLYLESCDLYIGIQFM